MELLLIGDREDENGREAGAPLHRGPFAGWGAPNTIAAAVRMRPLRFVVLGKGIVLLSGTVEPVQPVDAGEAFTVEVAAPLAPGQPGYAPTAKLTISA